MDRRVRKTQKAIIDAFLSLLDKKGFEQITINDIAEKADVNRSTIYFHYADKYALFEKCIEQYLGNIFVGCSSDSPEDLLLHTFSYIEHNIVVFQLLHKENKTGFFHAFLIESIREHSHYNLSSTDSLKREIQQEFLISATAGIFEWYIQNAHKYKAVDVMHRYKEMVHEYNIVSD
jgi:AcrR family transcriptional regulator